MYKLSVTTIDSFYKFYYGDKPEEEFVKSIKGEFEPNIYMELGTAFHDIIENRGKRLHLEFEDSGKESYYLSKNNIAYGMKTIDKCLELLDYDYKFGINEVGTTRTVLTPYGACEIHARADWWEPTRVIEVKTAWSAFNSNGFRSFFNTYYDSLQWKFYLWLYRVDRVEYKIFLFNQKAMELDSYFNLKFDTSQYEPNLLKKYINECLEYLYKNNLLEYITI